MEQCDNGNQTGCKTGCIPDLGYTCTGALGSPSVCSTVCGDSIKAGSEQCDNGNKIGCQTGCAPDLGFTCTGAIGAASTCAVTCGDGVKGGDE